MINKARVLSAFLSTSCLLTGLASGQGARKPKMDSSSSVHATTLKTAGPTIVAGEAIILGDGTVRSWVARDKDGKPTAVGVTFSEAALTGLPQSHGHGLGPEYMLSLPPEASSTGIGHIVVNWNPKGHEPEGIYNVPHFDFHFYLISPTEREMITAQGDDLEKCRKAIPAEFVPEGYVQGPGSEVPRMGSHWFAGSSHEFHGQAFTHTFIYGSYDGRMIFLEPMITKAFLETRPDITVPIRLPSKYQQPGYYPTQYSVRYNEESSEYTVSISGLTLR